jgi:hypothetical protein
VEQLIPNIQFSMPDFQIIFCCKLIIECWELDISILKDAIRF